MSLTPPRSRALPLRRLPPIAALGLALLTPLAASSTDRTDFLYRNSEPNGSGMPYRLFVPEAVGPASPRPLILFLHGAGETGANNEDQLDNRANGAMELVDGANLALEPSFLAAPQTPAGTWADATRQAQLADIVEDLIAEFPIDPDRVYVTGLSMGGNGTWSTLSTQPHRFAAAVPICGWGDGGTAPSLDHLPIWFFHAVNDGTVGVAGSRNLVGALRAAGGDPIYTEFALGGHGIWSVTYALPQLFRWLIAQRRGTQPAAPPPPSLRILEPTGEPVWVIDSTDDLEVSGSADGGAAGVAAVEWFAAAGSANPASGTTQWSAEGLPIVTGSQRFRIQARGPSDHSPWGGTRTWSDTITAIVSLPPPAPGSVVHAIDSGGGPYSAEDGTEFSADAWFVGGATQVSSDPVAGTVDDPLFHAWRWGGYSYLAPVPIGRYAISLYFAETYNTASGQRIFDLAIEGAVAENDLDIAAVAGADTALVRTHEVDVADGELEIRLVAGAIGNPRLDAWKAVYLGPVSTIFVDGFATGDGLRWSALAP